VKVLSGSDSAFLANLGLEILFQDGGATKEGPTHATAHPVYMVEQKVTIYGIDTSHTDPDGYELLKDGESIGTVSRRPENLADGVDAVGFIHRWELVQGAVAFTRKGIEAYLAANGHNLRHPRIFVASLHRVEEMIRLRRLLCSPSTTGLAWWSALHHAAVNLSFEKFRDAVSRDSRFGTEWLEESWGKWGDGGLRWLDATDSVDQATRDRLFLVVVNQATSASEVSGEEP
jgi:hypothetical protein